MDQSPNPYAAPEEMPPGTTLGKRRRTGLLLGTACLGIIVGSYISAELLYFHHQAKTRVLDDVVSNSIGSVIMSPLSMTFGIIPTLKFHGSHGFLVPLGMLTAIAGSRFYWLSGRLRFLLFVFTGSVLWAHNNFLSFSAMMSV